MMLLPETSWEIKKTNLMGRGIFAKKDILPGTVIGEYTGLVIKTKEKDLYEKGGHFYLMHYHDRASVYPDPEKAGIHLINHSCMPNCWMYPYKGHALYFALRRIFAGEELTVNYILEPECDPPCLHQCVCGTDNCSGTMHPSEKDYKKWMAKIKQQSQLTKLDRIRYGKMLPKLDSYPKMILDDSLYPLFGSREKPPARYKNKEKVSPKKLREYIRNTGRKLEFPIVKLRVLGVKDNKIISEPIV